MRSNWISALAALVTLSTTCAAQTNLVPSQPYGEIVNGSAEQIEDNGLPLNWTVRANRRSGRRSARQPVGATVDSTMAHDGSHSLVLDAGGGPPGSWQNRTFVYPFATYEFTGWIKTENVREDQGATFAFQGASQRATWIKIRAGAVALSTRPGHRVFPPLVDAGCTHCLSLLGSQENPGGTARLCAASGIEWLHLPLRNGNPPGKVLSAQVGRLFTKLEALLEQGSRILIHCSGGIHRTGMLTFAFLRFLRFSRAQAQATLRELRPITGEQVGAQRLAWGDKFAQMPKRFKSRMFKALASSQKLVSRSTRWGNPFSVEGSVRREKAPRLTRKYAAKWNVPVHELFCDADEEAVDRYRQALINGDLDYTAKDVQNELRGYDLGCPCGAVACHADVLIGLANA